jgi:hypothetical protein
LPAGALLLFTVIHRPGLFAIFVCSACASHSIPEYGTSALFTDFRR